MPIIVELSLGRYVSRTVPAFRVRRRCPDPTPPVCRPRRDRDPTASGRRAGADLPAGRPSRALRSGQRRDPHRRQDAHADAGRPRHPDRRSVSQHQGARALVHSSFTSTGAISASRSSMRTACRWAGGSRGSDRMPSIAPPSTPRRPTFHWAPTGPDGTAWCWTIRSWLRARICSVARTRRASAEPDGRLARGHRRERGSAAGWKRARRWILDRRVAQEFVGHSASRWATGSPAARVPGRCAGSRSRTCPSSGLPSSATSPSRADSGPGWQIEAYRGGRLLAIDSANGLGASRSTSRSSTARTRWTSSPTAPSARSASTTRPTGW